VADRIVLEGDELIRVVGTSHYQDAMLELAPREADEAIRVEKVAVLVPEPDNPHDPNAIAVHIDGRLVGYLSREENVRWKDVVADNEIAGEAMIAGKGGTTGLGVFLRLPTPTEARAQVGLWKRGREAR
jgi:HIRAN domain